MQDAFSPYAPASGLKVCVLRSTLNAALILMVISGSRF